MRPYFLPERLQKIRESLGLSQTEVAGQLGISKSAYHYYETGERNPTLPILERIAQILCTNVDYLTGASDHPEIQAILITDPELVLLLNKARKPSTGSASDEQLARQLLSCVRKSL